MINIIKGDATHPIGDGIKIICHICNDVSLWGAGFVLAISKRWEKPEQEYLKLPNLKLGHVQPVVVEKDIIVANMVAQRGVGLKYGPPIRYDAVKECLEKVNELAVKLKRKTGLPVSLHMPKIGSGLAGGNWATIFKIITEAARTDTTVYEFD